MLCLILLQPIVWWWVDAEIAKVLVQLLAGCLLVIVALEVAGMSRLAPAARPALLITLCLALGSCFGEQYLFARDFGWTQAEIDRVSCADARRIFTRAQGMGRQWQAVAMGQPTMYAAPPRPWRVINLYLSRVPGEGGAEAYVLRAGAWASDDVFGNIECTTALR